MTSNAATPLAGVRVVDLTTFLSGPYATAVLGQLGAEVVKVEPPTGDPTRGGQPNPQSDLWRSLHRGRRSVVLDLKNDSGREVLFDLVRCSDVVVENFRSGVMQRLGIAPPVLREVNPRIITCSISGYGPGGPMSPAAAIDGVVQAFSGGYTIPPVWGLPEGPIPFQVADLAGGSAAAQAVLAALYVRERTGVGTHTELSLAECVLNWFIAGDRSGTLRSPNTILATGSDGGRFAVQTTLHFKERLATLLGLTFEQSEAYADAARAVLATKPRDEWIALLFREGIPVAPIQTIAEALDHEQVAADDVAGARWPASPFVIDGERLARTVPSPVLGADTEAVLTGHLGYDAARVQALREARAFG
jgi:CoA:oxalate CoA-transferase